MLISPMAYQSEIEKLEQRYRENPDQWFAALADSYRKAGQLDLALEVVRGGLERRPNYVSGHIVLGRCLLQKPDDEAAASAFERVLSLDAENVIALKALAEIHERAGRLDQAQRWLSRLLEVDPMNEEAEQALGRLQQASPAAPQPAAAEPQAGAEAVEAAAAGVEAGAPEATAAPLALGAREPSAAPAASAEAPEAAPAVAGPELHREQPAQLAETLAEAPLEPVGELELEPQAPGAPEEPEFVIEKSGEQEEAAWASRGGEPESAVAEGTAPPPADLVPVEFTPPVEPPPADLTGGLELEPFDTNLAWGTGERISRQISEEDLRAAERAREAALDVPVHALPGLEDTEVPPVAAGTGVPPVETESPLAEVVGPEVAPAAERVAGAAAPIGAAELGKAEDAAGPASDLPLIFPEEVAPAAERVAGAAAPIGAAELGKAEDAAGPASDLPLIFPEEAAPADEPKPQPQPVGEAEAPAAAEPEPVVTETMAQLYASQGLLDEARGIYQQLVEQRPDDAALQDRLAALGAEVHRPVSTAARLSAAYTGGPSVREFLAQVFGPGEAAAEPGAPGAEPVEEDAARRPEGIAGSPLGAGASEEDPGSVPGAPTLPATDEVSLAAVFGEEPAPLKRPPPAASDTAPAGGSGFSFDEFFGGQRPAAAPPSSPRSGPAGGGEDDDEFKRWLKGLKS